MARNNTPDELQYLRKRARRRLVGAVALVLFSLTVLWTVLDSRPPASLVAQHSVEIIASAPGDASASAMVAFASAPEPAVASPVQPEALTAPAAVASSAPVVADPKQAAVTGSMHAPQQLAAVAASPGTHATQALPGKLMRNQGEPAPKVHAATPTKPADSKPKADARLQNKPAAKPRSEPDPESILNGTDDSSAKPDANAVAGRHYVQLGSYGDEEKARQLVDKLKTAGLPAFSEKAASGMTRVRVGPVPAGTAYNIAKKLDGMGYQGQVISK